MNLEGSLLTSIIGSILSDPMSTESVSNVYIPTPSMYTSEPEDGSILSKPVRDRVKITETDVWTQVSTVRFLSWDLVSVFLNHDPNR